VLLETVFSAILAPIMAVAHIVFLVCLAFGRTIGWTAQVRDDHRVPFGAAASRLSALSVRRATSGSLTSST
jgi:membrane glycosyltransferase